VIDLDFAAITFWVCAPIVVLLGLGMVLARKVVHSALCLVGVMITLGVLYATLDAPFLFVAQLLVYTGSVMMLFLFTMMLIGIDTAEEMKETIRGQRVAAIIAALGLASLLVITTGHGIIGQPAGLETANDVVGGNAQAVAEVIFGRYAVAFEAASALVITAALAAMVLAHAERLTPKEGQRGQVSRRLREFADKGKPLAPHPGPGVYARHNASSYPALLPNGQGATESVAEALIHRGQNVIGHPSLKNPAAIVHNQLAGQSLALDGRPSLTAPIEVAPPALTAPDAATVVLPPVVPNGNAAAPGRAAKGGAA